MADVTQILSAIESGDPKAADQLLPLVYDELRRLAAQRLAQEKPGQTLQATALVHEAYLRLIPNAKRQHGGPGQQWDSRGHFFAAAAEAMRRILVESARRKKRLKHGGGLVRVELEDADLAPHLQPDDLLALDDALDELAKQDAAKAKLVELRFFVGLSTEEAADFLGISAVTAKRHWRYAKAWLHQAIAGSQTSGVAKTESAESGDRT